ncbi:MAG: hypothetical protein MJ211_08695 [Bacteroidales bacterium]|nr:hypothetical protein [Bacteroidales bacterium]
MEQSQYFENYENNLKKNLVDFCTEKNYLSGMLLETIDITEKWDSISPSYIADASKEINKYPAVSLGWAMYLGMAVAKYWDSDWNIYGKHPNLYEHLKNKRGFDYMDEVVRGEILGLKDDQFTKCEDFVRSCTLLALNKIRQEGIEPCTPSAFFVYTLSCKVLYLIGASITLRKLGYVMEKL